MKLSRSVSMTVFVGALGGVALALWVTAVAGTLSSWGVTAALLAALIPAILAHEAVRLLVEREVSRFEVRLRHGGDDEPDFPNARPWLRPLQLAVDRQIGRRNRRIEELRRRRSELEARVRIAEEERQQARTILSSILDPVLVTDAFNELVLANDAACDAIGLSSERDMHQPIGQVIDAPELVKMIKDAREAGDPTARRRTEHRIDGDQATCIYDVTICSMTDARGEVTGVVTVLRDVTREREIVELKSDFVSGVSHELRTPLSSIKAYVEMLVDGEAEDPASRNEFYNIIQSEANRLSRLIDNILNISRIESGIVRVQREPVSVARVVREAADVIQPQARARRIELDFRPLAEDYRIQADWDMILQALLNLLGNAIKYTPAGGRVALETEVDEAGERVAIHVRDTGIGIPPDALPHLFEKFYRVSDHKKMAKGTGLGLNLVKHVIETVHEGAVRVRSGVNEGSVFTIELPLDRTSAEPTASPPDTVEATSHG